MIFPWLKGFLKWDLAPLTWALLGTNVFVFFLTYQKIVDDRSFTTVDEMVLSGRLFQQYQNQKNHLINQHNSSAEIVSFEKYIILGSQALRDPEFIKQASTFSFDGDQVAIARWKTNLDKHQQAANKRVSKIFGLLANDNRPLTWLTYQFMHAGFFHLFSNMILLLLFAAVLEQKIGGLGILLVYIFSGVAGGLAFFFLSGPSAAPMIGASGAVSGVMACYAALEVKKRISFFYFLSPIPGYYGLIYLPTYLIYPLCFLSDIANYLSTPLELGSGVAHTAHIGGAVFGLVVGFAIKFSKQKYTRLNFHN